MKLQGRVAIITGASRGIGRELALTFAREGADLVLAAKTIDPDPKLPGTLPEVVAEVEKLGRRAIAVQTDVRDETQIQHMVSRALETFGRIDLMINNAGALYWQPVSLTPAKRFDLVVNVNARAAFLCAQACLPAMRQQRYGHIVNMSPPLTTETAKGAAPGHVAYMISKFGMTLLTLGLSAEERENNIAVHSLWPATLVESLAVINNHIGDRSQWRKPSIIADATLALVARDPSERSGRAWLDEEVLREEGITDFSSYACVPGTDPPRIPLDHFGDQ